MHIAVLGSGPLILSYSQCQSDILAGFMGTAILSGLLKKIPSDSTPKINYTAGVRSSESLDRLKTSLGKDHERVNCIINDFTKAAQEADVVLLGVPPGELKALLGLEGMSAALAGKVTISLLAGTTCDQVLQTLTSFTSQTAQEKKSFDILRVIPSIGAQNNDSVTLIAQSTHAGSEPQKLCNWLFSQIGGTHLLPENLMDEATAAGAACHALAWIAVDAVTDASVAEGIPRSVALKLAAQSLQSAAGLLVKDMSPQDLREAMSVPRGITTNSALELEKEGVRSGISEAVRFAIRYARSMS
jgi:pyrroline-5-carboxylate reductase